jgi:SAM-dependent MidA family methyltransferase
MTELKRLLQEEIGRRGAIPFSEFMRCALYHAEYGYYRSPERIGKSGDFFTSVSVGGFFGSLLAFQFGRWFEQLGSRGRPLRCVEAGAHDGRLACDILSALQREPLLFDQLEYWIVEPSARLRRVQEVTLSSYSNVRWVASIADINDGVTGVIFGNELLDAMPVHLFRWSQHEDQWREMGVGMLAEEFAWERLPEPTVEPPRLPEALLKVLPNDYSVEISPEASQWWASAAAALRAGKLLTIDYGGIFEELLSPGRASGTLRAYSRQRINGDVLSNPGEQDITAHVNFTELQDIGRAAGLRTEVFTTQSQFLTEIARELWNRTGSWPADQVRQFQTLTHPEHLGHPFRVLVQGR